MASEPPVFSSVLENLTSSLQPRRRKAKLRATKARLIQGSEALQALTFGYDPSSLCRACWVAATIRSSASSSRPKPCRRLPAQGSGHEKEVCAVPSSMAATKRSTSCLASPNCWNPWKPNLLLEATSNNQPGKCFARDAGLPFAQ